MQKNLTQSIKKKTKPLASAYVISGLLYSCALTANDFTAEQERWLNSNDETDISLVNEGKLEFILKPINKKTLHSINKLTISQQSIDEGWVDLQQCYRYLDKLPELDISYQYRFIKDLTLLSIKNIDSAEINQQTITLNNIRENSELCVSAEVRIFYQDPDLSFSLINGPYHRRFLDGFYPYHLSLHIQYPQKLLSYKGTLPEQQAGFTINHQTNKILIDGYFKGILNTEVSFQLKVND